MNSISPAHVFWLFFRIGLGMCVMVSCGFIAWGCAMGAATTPDLIGRFTLCLVALFFLLAAYSVFRILIYCGGEFRLGSVLPVMASLLAMLFTLGALIWPSHIRLGNRGGGRPPGGGTSGPAIPAPLIPRGPLPTLSASAEFPEE